MGGAGGGSGGCHAGDIPLCGLGGGCGRHMPWWGGGG